MKIKNNRLTVQRDPEQGGGGGGGQDQQQQQQEQGKQYTPPASQEELDRIIGERVARERSKYADYDVHKANSEKWAALEQESQTDAERRERELREEAFNEAMSKAVPIAVRTAFKAEAKGVLEDEQVASLLEDLDLVKYATDEGEPDWAKIEKKVKTFAPKQGKGGDTGRGPGFGQGNGHNQSTKLPGEAGLAEAQRRFGKPVAAGQQS